jgi:hypothetical protein
MCLVAEGLQLLFAECMKHRQTPLDTQCAMILCHEQVPVLTALCCRLL